MGKLILYGMEASPPVRAVLLTLKALKLPFEFVHVDLLGKEHLTPEFLAKNPQHTVPTLADDNNYICDSHAINAYLVSKYGNSDELYPRDLLQRAMVDQRLHFESSQVFTGALRSITVPLFFRNEINVIQSKIDAVYEVYHLMEVFLKQQPYVAGNNLTIADFSLIATLTSLDVIVKIDTSKYPKLAAWMQRIKQLSYYREANGNGVEQFATLIKAKNLKIVP